MGIQAIFDDAALEFVPNTCGYIKSIEDVGRRGHHYAVIIREISNSLRRLDDMMWHEIEAFDLNCVNYLKSLDGILDCK